MLEVHFMKRIEGTILVECDVCYHVNPETYTNTCHGCGHTVCLKCALQENFECVVCGGYFIEPGPY